MTAYAVYLLCISQLHNTVDFAACTWTCMLLQSGNVNGVTTQIFEPGRLHSSR